MFISDESFAGNEKGSDASRNIKVLFILNHPVEDGSARYRIYQFLPYFEAAGFKCYVRPFSTASLLRALRSRGNILTSIVHAAYCTLRRARDVLQASRYDIVVIHREAFPFLRPAVERLMMRHCARSIFSFDDAIYAGHDDCSKLNHPRLYRYKYSGDLGSVIAGATHVIAGNSTLAGYARQFSEAVTVIPTVVDLQHYPFSPPNECSPLTIGWFGSNSTSPYLEQVLPALREIEFRFGKKVRFRFFGDPTFKPDLKRSESLPFRLSSEIEDLRSLDIGIMPMPDTPWTRGKCSFKAIQYMALGIPAVVSPIGSAADIIEHEKTGLWAITEAEWISSLSRLIQDKAYRREIAFRARLRVEENYSVQRWAPVFVEVINNVLKHPATAKNSLQVASPA